MSTQPNVPASADTNAAVADPPVAIPSYINDAIMDLETKKVISRLYLEFAARLPAEGGGTGAQAKKG